MLYSRIEVTQEYFEQLNYTLANEDTRLEMELLPFDQGHVAAVCGSGSRIIPLLCKRPQKISVIDLSKSQLGLCELRIQTLKSLTHEEFLKFWGYRKTHRDDRKKLFDRIELSSGNKKYFQQFMEKNQWESLLYAGRWEKTFVLFSRIAKVFLGKKTIERLFSCQSLTEQQSLIHGKVFDFRWRALLLLLGNSRTFNALLYGGSFPVNNTSKSYLKYYHEAFQRLFNQGLARENFFLQLALLGEMNFPEGFPVEADALIFEEAKKNLSRTKIEFIQKDLIDWVSSETKIDFISFSNVASYFKGEKEKNFLKRIRNAISARGKLVMRHYLHHPEGLDREGFSDETGRYLEIISKEKMQMYEIEILEKSIT
jgi:S-adenosylmethionine-diacylglycerol 3-amino-3-carboxypropyl transferase